MKTKDTIMILTLWIVLLIFLGAILIKVQPKIITKEVPQTCVPTDSHTDSVYLIDRKEVKLLPFCGLVWEDDAGLFWKDEAHTEYAPYCYDWASDQDGHSGVSIINLTK